MWLLTGSPMCYYGCKRATILPMAITENGCDQPSGEDERDDVWRIDYLRTHIDSSLPPYNGAPTCKLIMLGVC